MAARSSESSRGTLDHDVLGSQECGCQTCYSILTPVICAMQWHGRQGPRFSGRLIHVLLFRNAQFEISIAKPSGLPPPGAGGRFAGRSNAGKSSAINTLANHVRLAFVSKRPAAPS